MFRPLVNLLSSEVATCQVIKEEKYLKSYKIPDTEFRNLVGGIKFRDTKLGDGEAVEFGDVLKVQYVGRLLGGREIESTMNRPGNSVSIMAGGSDILKGVSQGVIGMKEYGSRELLLPPSMHYPDKYPNQIMIYEVMVRTIVRKAQPGATN